MSEIAEFFTDYQTKRTENPARTHRYTLTRLVKPQTGPGRMGGAGGHHPRGNMHTDPRR